MNFINGITILLIYQLIGELSVILLRIPVPGPVLGMMLLFLSLLLRGRSNDALTSVSTTLLKHLSLLFIPAGVGVMVHLDRIINAGWAISITLLLSTVITMVATAAIMLLFKHWLSKGRQQDV